MATTDWFYACDGQQSGPVSAAELKQLAESGKLKPDDLIWQEGMREWIAARKVKGLFEAKATAAVATPPAAPPVAAPAAAAVERPKATFERSSAVYQRSREGGRTHPLDGLLTVLRGQFGIGFVLAASNLFTVLGYYGSYAAAVVLLGLGVLETLKFKAVLPVLASLAGAAALLVWQHAAGRLLTASERLVRAAPARVSSSMLLDLFGLANMLFGLVALVGLSMAAVQWETAMPILPGVAAFVLCVYLGVLSLSPEGLAVTVSTETTLTDEALGLAAFLVKAMLRMAPVAFGIAVVWLAVSWLYQAAILGLVMAGVESPFVQAEFIRLTIGTFFDRTPVILGLLLLPMWAYLALLAYQLVAELIRSVLATSERLGRLVEDKNKDGNG